MNQVNQTPWPKFGKLALVILIFLSLGCQKKATAATVRELERRLILLELKLRETEGRLMARMDQLAETQSAPKAPQAIQTETQPVETAEEERRLPKVADPEPPRPTNETSVNASKGVNPAGLSPVAQDRAEPVNSKLPLIARRELKASYKKALTALESRQFDRAERLLTAILEQHPDHGLAPNAAYWLGEVFYSRYQFKRALVAFGRVYADYPKSHKVADALLKQGRCHERLGQLEQARAAYIRVIEQFPRSAAAALARKWL